MQDLFNTESPLRAVGYKRVSMQEQVDGFSLDAQENSIRAYAEKQGWQLVKIYEDAGISAKKGSYRPSFEQLLKDVRQDQFDVVIVNKIDRFYRHLNGLLTALDYLNEQNVTFASVQEQMDFSTPWGKLILNVLGTLAEIYIDNLRKEVCKGTLQRAKKGLWLGALPYGYCDGLCSTCTNPNGKNYCPNHGKENLGNGKVIVAHPVESEVVKLVFQWYSTGEESHRTIEVTARRSLSRSRCTVAPKGLIRIDGMLFSLRSALGYDADRQYLARVWTHSKRAIRKPNRRPLSAITSTGIFHIPRHSIF